MARAWDGFADNKEALKALIDYLETGNTHGVWYSDEDLGPGGVRYDPEFYIGQQTGTAVHLVDNRGRYCVDLKKLKEMAADGWELNATNEWVYDPRHWRDEQEGDDESMVTVGLDGGLFPLSETAKEESSASLGWGEENI